jgi:hypothetical protein
VIGCKHKTNNYKGRTVRKEGFLFILLVVFISCGPVVEQNRPSSSEVRLDVPFEPNLGGTCFSSSFAMVMRYWGQDVHVEDVVKVVGRPPFKGYEHPELNWWMKRNYKLKFKYLLNSSVEQVKRYLNEGYPVIVHQMFSSHEPTGHDRVVVGYSDKKGVFIVNDPSPLGKDHEIYYAEFSKLWREIASYETWGPANKAYLVMPIEQ